MPHALRLSRPEGARPCLWCDAAQPQPISVTCCKTRGAARALGWQWHQTWWEAGAQRTLEGSQLQGRW